MKVVITGGSGFIGSHLADLLIELKHEVIVIDNLSIGRIENISHLLENPNFTFLKADIVDFDSIESIFNNIDWVFHLAALADIVPSIENPKEYYLANVNGTFNVLQACKKHKVKKIIYFQRYNFDNHLNWLINKRPNGHNELKNVSSKILKKHYEKLLIKLKLTDTLIAVAE